MEVNPGTSTKRSRAKVKDPVAAEAAAPAKKRSTRKKSTPTIEAEAIPVLSTSIEVPSEATLNSMIATAAYYLAAERGFAPGHELDDWLEAERRIRSKHLS
jgi:hypothetical protein